MAKHKKPRTYEELRDDWYQKLAKSGFVEIENVKADNLKQHHANRFYNSQPAPEVWQARQEYYTMAEHFLNEFQFENKLESVIWEYHVNAISIANIVKTINKTRRVNKVDHNIVWKTIKRLEATMKRKYMTGYAERETEH